MSGAPEQCGVCRFWHENESHRDPNDSGWGFGRCRRCGPVIVGAVVQAIMPRLEYGQQTDPEIDDVSMTAASLWPATHSADWCGEFQAAGEREPL